MDMAEVVLVAKMRRREEMLQKTDVEKIRWFAQEIRRPSRLRQTRGVMFDGWDRVCALGKVLRQHPEFDFYGCAACSDGVELFSRSMGLKWPVAQALVSHVVTLNDVRRLTFAEIADELEQCAEQIAAR